MVGVGEDLLKKRIVRRHVGQGAGSSRTARPEASLGINSNGAVSQPGTELFWRATRKNTKAARSRLPQDLWRIAVRKLDQLNRVLTLAELRMPPGNNLEVLRDDRKGQYSIRINDQYGICFEWTDEGPFAVEIVDYH
jgi:toxin HigB-1